MIRGISKKIIEVNNTGSEFFEKAVFYVKNDKEVGEKQLRAEADKFLYTYMSDYSNNYKKGFLRKKEQKRNANAVITTLAVSIVICLVIAFVLLF